MKTCTTCGEAYDDDVDMCPRDGTPLFAFASDGPNEPAEEPEHKVGTLEEVSDALSNYGAEEPDESFDENALFLDASSAAEDIEEEVILDADDLLLEEVPTPAEEPRENIVGAPSDVAHDDPTLATNAGSREELQRQALAAVQARAAEIEAQFAQKTAPEPTPAPQDDGFGSPASDPYFDDGFGVPDSEPQQDIRRTAMGMPTFQRPDASPQESRPQPQQQQFQAPQQQPQFQQPQQQFQQPQPHLQQPEHRDGPRVQTTLPHEQFEAPPVDATAEIIPIPGQMGDNDKKGAGVGRLVFFLFLAVLVGVGIGVAVYTLDLVPTDLLRGGGETASTEAPPAKPEVVPTPTEVEPEPEPEPEPVIEIEEIVQATADAGSTDAGSSADAGFIDPEAAGAELGEAANDTAAAVSEEVSETVEEEPPPKRTRKRRPRRRSKPKPKPEPKGDDASLSVWGSDSKEPAKKEPAKEKPAEKTEEKKDESLDIW